MVIFPFTENGNIRTFSKDVNQQELKWHWDEQDRMIRSLQETDWMIQFDNELPRSLNENLFISAGLFHRLIKGTNDLHLQIIKI
jgi:hypothetical protein